jgi:O-antigen ligase
LSLAAAYLIVVLGVAVLATLRWPIVGVCSFLLIDFLRPQDLHTELAEVRPVMWLMAATLLSTLWQARAAVPRAARQLAPLAVVLAVSALSAAASDLQSHAWGAWIALAKTVLIAMLVVVHVDSPRRIEAVLWIIVGSMSTLALASLAQGLAIGYPGAWTEKLGGLGAPVRTASIGAMHDNNAFARILVFSLPLCAVLARLARRLPARLLASLCGVAIACGLMMTFSRTGGIAAVAVAAAAVCWIRPRWKAFAVFLVVMTVAYAVAPERYRGRLQSVSPDDFSLKLRYGIWARGLQMAGARPVLGVGIGTFKEHYARTAPPPTRASHNVLIEVLAEMGVVGLLTYVWMLALVLWRLLRLARVPGAAERSEPPTAGVEAWARITARGLVVGLFGLLLASMTLGQPFSSHLMAALALGIALVNVASRSAATARADQRSVTAGVTSIEAVG